MSLPEEPILPPQRQDHAPVPPPVRRRRATRRSHIPTDAEGQAELIASLARRAYPSVELFVFSLVCGAILGLGYLLDSQAVLLFGLLVAPLMTPWVGFLLALLTGSIRFMFETLMALFISVVFVFLGGLLTGLAALPFMPRTFDNVFLHSRLWLPELIVFAIGVITLVVSFARSEERPFLPSVVLAYAFYLPVSAAGFGISSGLPDVWLQGLLVFAAHFTFAGILGLITLLILRLRPSTSGVAFSGIALILFSGILVILLASGSPYGSEAAVPPLPQFTPTNQIAAAPSSTSSLSPAPGQNPTRTAPPATRTPTTGGTTPENITPSPVPLTLEITLPPTETPTITLTIQPTPTYGRIAAAEGGGANLRDAPGGNYVMTLLNGTIVETYSEFQIVNGSTWVKVYALANGQRVEGWLLESVIAYATPAPNFSPSSTPTVTVAP